MESPSLNGEIIQGDCLKILPTLADNSVDLIVTDPPYGINFQSARRSEPERFDYLENDDKILTDWLGDAYRVLNGGAHYIFLLV